MKRLRMLKKMMLLKEMLMEMMWVVWKVWKRMQMLLWKTVACCGSVHFIDEAAGTVVQLVTWLPLIFFVDFIGSYLSHLSQFTHRIPLTLHFVICDLSAVHHLDRLRCQP